MLTHATRLCLGTCDHHHPHAVVCTLASPCTSICGVCTSPLPGCLLEPIRIERRLMHCRSQSNERSFVPLAYSRAWRICYVRCMLTTDAFWYTSLTASKCPASSVANALCLHAGPVADEVQQLPCHRCLSFFAPSEFAYRKISDASRKKNVSLWSVWTTHTAAVRTDSWHECVFGRGDVSGCIGHTTNRVRMQLVPTQHVSYDRSCTYGCGHRWHARLVLLDRRRQLINGMKRLRCRLSEEDKERKGRSARGFQQCMH